MKFALPEDVLEVGTGIKQEYAIKYGHDETKEEEVKWGVDSRIRVGPESSTLASVNIKESEFEKEFSCKTTTSGILVVDYTSKPRARERVHEKEFIGFADLIHFLKKFKLLPSESPDFFCVEERDKPMTGRVVSVLQGKCNFRLGVEQHVHLKEVSLNEIEAKEDEKTLLLESNNRDLLDKT